MLVKCYHPHVTVISKFGRHSVPPQLGRRVYGVFVISSVRGSQCRQSLFVGAVDLLFLF